MNIMTRQKVDTTFTFIRRTKNAEDHAEYLNVFCNHLKHVLHPRTSLQAHNVS